MLRGGERTVYCAHEVHIHHAVPVGFRHLNTRAIAGGTGLIDTGSIDHNVQGTPALHHLGHGLIDLFLIRDVEPINLRFGTGLLQLRRRCCQAIGI